MAQITVRSENGLRTAISVRDHTFYADEPPSNSGTDTAPTPTEMFVGSLGACMVITVQLYAQRKQWPLEEVVVSLSLERIKKEDYPAYTGDAPIVNQFRVQMAFKGSLTEEQKVRLHDIGSRCSIHRALQSPSFFVDSLPETQ
jgi:putative redox protein